MDSKNALEHVIDSCWDSSSKRCANRKSARPGQSNSDASRNRGSEPAIRYPQPAARGKILPPYGAPGGRTPASPPAGSADGTTLAYSVIPMSIAPKFRRDKFVPRRALAALALVPALAGAGISDPQDIAPHEARPKSEGALHFRTRTDRH